MTRYQDKWFFIAITWVSIMAICLTACVKSRYSANLSPEDAIVIAKQYVVDGKTEEVLDEEHMREMYVWCDGTVDKDHEYLVCFDYEKCSDPLFSIEVDSNTGNIIGQR